MTTDLRSRTHYLSLALFSQRAIGALLDYLDKGTAAQLQESLVDALRSLESLDKGELPSFSQRKAAVFGSYEQLRTLKEVWTREDRDRAMTTIGLLLTESADPGATRAGAQALIDLFERLGNQARWNFEQPDRISPRLVREPCQAQ